MRKKRFSWADSVVFKITSLLLACLVGAMISTAFFVFPIQTKILIKKLRGKKVSKLTPEETLALNDLANCIQKERNRPQSFESLSWKIYPKFVRFAASHTSSKDEEYARKGYRQGLISQSLAEGFKKTLEQAKIVPISSDDFDPNYIHPDLTSYEQPLNSSHKLFLLEEAQMKALEPILEELKEPIAACLGSPWSIINVLCWETFPDAQEVGPNSWHRDGLPFAVNKVMIYLTGASEENGTTTLQFDDGTTFSPEGPAGTWLLFKISEITHRGIKPKTGSRIALEVRVIPTVNYDLRPYAAGFNAYYPKLPWYEPLAKRHESFAPDTLR